MAITAEHQVRLDQALHEMTEGGAPHRAGSSRWAAMGDKFRPVLFGAGALGRVVLDGLRRGGVDPICYADNNPRRWGTNVDGLAVDSLAAAIDRHGRGVPIVLTIYTGAAVEAALRKLGLRVITFPELAQDFPDQLLPWGPLDLPSRMSQCGARIREAFSLWADDESREEYIAQVRFRHAFAGPVPPHLPAEATYFPDDLVELVAEEVFVDCGAFDGDSVGAFLRRTGGWFGGVAAIEADPQNAEKLRQFVGRLPAAIASSIRVIEGAVGSKNETIRFHATGTRASNLSDDRDAIEVRCHKLDDILHGATPSYIKMDIEGAEADALEGAREIIRRHAPVLAICLYHRQSDLWEIPLQVREMTDRYRFFLRRYSDDCWEQLLYAIPDGRARK